MVDLKQDELVNINKETDVRIKRLADEIRGLMRSNVKDFETIKDAGYPFIDIFLSNRTELKDSIYIMAQQDYVWNFKNIEVFFHVDDNSPITLEDLISRGYYKDLKKAISNPQEYVDNYIKGKKDYLQLLKQ